MTGRGIILFGVILALASPADAARKRVARKPAAPDITIINAGSEQAVSLGKTVFSRPFGAQLVDRISVAASYPGRATSYYLIRGDATGDCPTRYVVIERTGATEPVIGEPFGTCATGARGEASRAGFVVRMAATAAGGPPVRFRYEAGKMRLLDAMPAAAVADARGNIGFAARQASACRTPAAGDRSAQASLIADFERNYPAEFRREKRLKRAVISPDELRATVTGLACLSRWPGAEKVVPDVATPLFASERYGRAAFEMVQSIARDSNSDANLRSAVRAFGTEMSYRVDRREPL